MQASKNNFLILSCLCVVALILGTTSASAQQNDSNLKEETSATLIAPEGYMYVDSLIYVPVAKLDSLSLGVDVFDIDVRQSRKLEASMREYIRTNPSRTISGFRVRIFFDNKQSAKVESEKAISKFRNNYKDVSAYRTYSNPYFKVTVGDCRTRSEAMILLGRIKKDFPSAFVVKENISYPVLDKEHVYDIDTVKVLRPVVNP